MPYIFCEICDYKTSFKYYMRSDLYICYHQMQFQQKKNISFKNDDMALTYTMFIIKILFFWQGFSNMTITINSYITISVLFCINIYFGKTI